MADTPTFESPVVKTYPADGRAPLVLSDLSSTTKTIIRAAADSTVATTAPVGFGATRASGGVLVCGQRPGEWLLLGTAEANAAMVASIDHSEQVSVIDHTHSRALFRLTGAPATAALEKVCSIDWTDEMTPNGAVVSASIAKVNCDIARDDIDAKPSYLIGCDRSFGQYLFDALLDAGDEFDIGVG